MLDPLHFIFLNAIFICMHEIQGSSLSLPLTYKNEIYHEVYLQYFYNALLKAVTLTKSDVYIQYILHKMLFLFIELASVQGSSREMRPLSLNTGPLLQLANRLYSVEML